MADRVIVITGASSGLGAGMAAEFASLGHRLALCSRRAPLLEASDRVLTQQLDVVDPNSLSDFAAETMRRFGRMDLWINNAGILEPVRALSEADPDAWWRLMEVNVRGVALGSRAYVRQLKRSALPGVLINISSGAAKSAYAGWSAYGASKAAVDMLSECVAMEERDAGIRVHAVAPGVIDTEMQTHIRAAAPEDFPKVDKFIELKKRGDFNSPAYVARELLEIAFVRQPAEVVLRIPPEVRES